MTKSREKKIEDFDKVEWKKLDEVEQFENSIKGKWVQKGPYIINPSGKLNYAVYIGTEKRLTGIDENGKPILECI